MGKRLFPRSRCLTHNTPQKHLQLSSIRDLTAIADNHTICHASAYVSELPLRHNVNLYTNNTLWKVILLRIHTQSAVNSNALT